jgi:predicted Fe-Mo cluster-binding NifX family protein
MIAIPVNSKQSTTLSKLYGHAPFFALLSDVDGNFKMVENSVKGPKIAEFLKTEGVTSTIFYHMGEGVFNAFSALNLPVYTADKKVLTLDQIFIGLQNSALHEVTQENAERLLDPGSSQCNCERC